MKLALNIFILCTLYSCMPEENLPIRDMGEAPDYFIECYCKPDQQFALSATEVLPVSGNLKIDFSQELTVTIRAEEDIELFCALHTLPGSDFVYNYGSGKRLNPSGIDTLYLYIKTADKKYITAKTTIPEEIEIQNYTLGENEASICFYISQQPEQNYYIYSMQLQSYDMVLKNEVCYLDYSRYSYRHLIEKSLASTQLKDADKITLNLKRITKANYDYQISLNGANSANQSSITTPVPLKGNIEGTLGIFTCYTEDSKVIDIGK